MAAVFDPFADDDEIVIDGSSNDRLVAIDEEQQRAKDWLATLTAKTTKYVEILENEKTKVAAGESPPPTRFRFEDNAAQSQSTSKQPTDKAAAASPSGDGGRLAKARSYASARNWAILVGVLLGLLGWIALVSSVELAWYMAVILFLIFVIVGGLSGYGLMQLIKYRTTPKTS